MAKKKNSEPAASPESRGGFSKEAWVAIGTLGAALITGVVTLIIHLYPPTPSSVSPSNRASASPEATATRVANPSPSRGPATNADAIAGKWLGPATDNTGKSFLVTLQIRKSCEIGQKCGSISVSHVPCYGEVFLEREVDGDFEFRVANFYGESNRQSCQPGEGEHFKLRSDNKLVYTTSYEPKASGLLEKQEP